MRRTVKTKIRNLTQAQYEHLRGLCQVSKNLYNQALYAVRQEFRNTGKYLSYGETDRLMKQTANLEGGINYRMLKAGVSQQILRRLDKNYRSFFSLLKTCPDMNPRPPKYIRTDFYNLIYDSQRFQVRDGLVILDKTVSVRIPSRIAGKKIVQVEIIHKFRQFNACFVYEDDTVYGRIEPNGRVAGIDLGLNNLAAVATSGGDAMLINGRPVKSINQFYNKKLAGIKSELKKRNGREWSEKAQKLTEKRNNKIADYQHKASRKIVNFCLEREISAVAVGDVSKSVNGISLGKRTNQNFVNVALGQFANKLGYKLEAHGIKVVKADESYTSKASFADNDPLPEKYEPDKEHHFSGKRIKRGLYRTAEGLSVNADLNGAFNIIRKAVPEFDFQKLKDGIEGLFIPHCRLLTC